MSLEAITGTEETALMRQSRSTDQTSTSGVSSQQLPIQVTNEVITSEMTILNCNILFSRVRFVFSVSGGHVVFGGRTDDCCRLLQHSQ